MRKAMVIAALLLSAGNAGAGGSCGYAPPLRPDGRIDRGDALRRLRATLSCLDQYDYSLTPESPLVAYRAFVASMIAALSAQAAVPAPNGTGRVPYPALELDDDVHVHRVMLHEPAPPLP